MSAKPRVRLSDDERKKFDSIGLDDINAIVDVAELPPPSTCAIHTSNPSSSSSLRSASMAAMISVVIRL